jgi:nickel-type superoxide dismutase maturation protease
VAASVALAAGGLVAFLRLAAERLCIEGASMAPVLVDGDRVLVERLVYRLRPPRPGEIVLARVARVPGGLAVKRVVAVSPRGRAVVLLGDNRAASTDSRHFGPVARGQIVGRVWYRYWPPHRRGRVLGRPAAAG